MVRLTSISKLTYLFGLALSVQLLGGCGFLFDVPDHTDVVDRQTWVEHWGGARSEVGASGMSFGSLGAIERVTARTESGYQSRRSEGMVPFLEGQALHHLQFDTDTLRGVGFMVAIDLQSIFPTIADPHRGAVVALVSSYGSSSFVTSMEGEIQSSIPLDSLTPHGVKFGYTLVLADGSGFSLRLRDSVVLTELKS